MYPKLCYVASYHSCTKSQTIDLVKDYGISKNILHNPKYQFDIDIMEWFIMEGPCRYEVIVSLRDENNRMIQELQCDSKFCTEFENGKWGKMHRSITVCGIRRLRFITFYHGATCNEPVPTHENNVQGNNIKNVSKREALTIYFIDRIPFYPLSLKYFIFLSNRSDRCMGRCVYQDGRSINYLVVSNAYKTSQRGAAIFE